MLCDIALKTLERAAEVTRRRLVKSTRPTDPIETEAGIDTLCRAIRNGQRFVLSPLFVETAAQLAEPRAVERSRDYIFAPADITWLEWEGDAPGGNPRSRRHALLLVGEGAGPAANRNTIMLGWGAYFALDGDPFPLIFSYDLPATDRPILRWQRSPVEMLSGLPDAHIVAGALDAKRLGTFLGAALALLNTPRIAQVAEHDHSTLNRARMRLKRPPILSYNDVRIMIDRGALGLGEQLSETGGRARATRPPALAGQPALRRDSAPLHRPARRGRARLMAGRTTTGATHDRRVDRQIWRGAMTPAELKSARHALGLSVRQMAQMLDTDEQTVRRMEMEPDRSTARPVAARMARLIAAYVAGYRPSDWPQISN